MIKKYFFFLIALASSGLLFAQSGTLKGKVTDAKTKEAIGFANVLVMQGGQNIGGTMTDIDGNYTVKPIPAGRVNVKVLYMGYQPLQYNNIIITPGKTTYQNFKIKATAQMLKAVVIKEYKVKLIDKDQTQTGKTVTSEDIEKMAARSATAVASTSAGVFSRDGEMGSVRGARQEATTYYVDGVKVRGSSAVPKGAIDQVTVITGGLSAQYGDATGGIINITTKGPSKETHGGAEVYASLDGYGNYLAELTLTGPLFSKKTKDPNDSTKVKVKPIVGYFFSADATYVKGDQPSAIDNWHANAGMADSLLAEPYRASSRGSITIKNADYLREDSFEKIKAKENIGKKSLNLAGKLTYQPVQNVNLTVGGSMMYMNRRMYSFSNILFNANNNGQQIKSTWRVYGRFSQNFRAKTPEEEAKMTIKHAYYQLQVDYSKTTNLQQDANHKDHLFDYGYVGKFKTYKVRSYEAADTLSGYENRTLQMHNGYMDTLYTFSDSTTANPGFAAYTDYFYSLYPLHSGVYRNKETVQFAGGLLNGDLPTSVYSLFASPGTPYTGYSHSDARQLRITGLGSGDYKNHAIMIGFEFEQRTDRYFGVSPTALWTLARSLVNSHITQLDKSNPHPVYVDGVFQDTINYDRLYDGEAQSEFDMKLREHLGMAKDGTNWIDLDSYDPSDMSLNYFSADELLNSGKNSYVAYYGYDHHGHQLTTKPSFDDFFTAKDEDGKYTRPVAPFEPNYSAAYIQDKFAFNDLIFNIGLRVDRFDANQKVLKDPYLFYNAYTLGEVKEKNPSLLAKVYGDAGTPSNIGDDYIVYVDNVDNPTSINGYRTGKDPSPVKFYTANGTLTNDPSLLKSATGLAPYLVKPEADMSPDAFEDYTPQITVMPRISFSFPISDVALFFAHYDILSKRPGGQSRLNMVQYYYITTQGTNTINNPNLKPEKTIDYEFGFQQKLNDVSSLKLSTFYREMRDMVQVQYIYGAYPADYITQTNIDFGTVKGMSLTYDLRRVSNVRMTASYTLQFANGTGSSTETAKTLIASGEPNIRTTLPLNFDQRHAITVTLDYRFKGGEAYNGPKWFGGKPIFENTGANFTIRYGTGTPYSKRDVVTNYLVGSMNGSRMPSTFTIDMRIDRDIRIGKEDAKHPMGLNVYLTVQNLLDTKNVISVYSTTGNPDDDGYLASANNQALIDSQNDPDSYRMYYSMYLQRPWMYSLPRRIQIGAILSF